MARKMKVYSYDELNEKTLSELREICSKYNIAGMSKKRKDIIIETIIDAASPADEKPSYDNNSSESNNVQDKLADNSSPIVAINANVASYRNLNAGEGDDKYVTNITVSCGASSGNFPVVGKTVGEVSEALRDALNIDRLSIGVVNGSDVEDSYILKTNDNLEFLKAGGRKG